MKKVALFATALCLMIGTAMAQNPVKSTSVQKTAAKEEKKDSKAIQPTENAVAMEKTADKKCCGQKNTEHKNCANAATNEQHKNCSKQCGNHANTTAKEQHKNCTKQCGNHANTQKAPVNSDVKVAPKSCAKASNCPKTVKADKQNANDKAVSK